MRNFLPWSRPHTNGTNGHRPSGGREAYRVLRSNLLVAIRDLDNPVVVVTSASSGEGKTSTCVGLAQSLATAGSHVILVDLCLDAPGAHRLIGSGNEFGATDVLLERRVLEDCLRYVEFAVPESPRPAGMFFLAAGPRAASSADLLSSPQAGRLLSRLATGADIVLVDSPPVLASADALAIGRLAAGAVLVVEAGKTTVPAVQRAKDALTRDQTRLLGVVLNRFQPALAGAVYGDHVPDYGHGY